MARYTFMDKTKNPFLKMEKPSPYVLALLETFGKGDEDDEDCVFLARRETGSDEVKKCRNCKTWLPKELRNLPDIQW